jgi:hypothetical protein
VSALWKRGTDAAAGASGAAKTSQTYLLGVGASGALLAGAGVALISLVGLVSFDVWPGTPAGVGPQEEAQLNIGGSASEPEVSLSEVVDVLSSGTPLGTAEAPAPAGTPDGSEKRPPKTAKPAPAVPAPTAPPAPVPVDEGGGGVGGGGSGSSGDTGTVVNPPTSTGNRNPNARSDPGKPPKGVPPGHSRRGGRQDVSAGAGDSGTGGSRGPKLKPPHAPSEPSKSVQGSPDSPSKSRAGGKLKE